MEYELICTHCINEAICSMKNDMIAVSSAIENCDVYLGNNNYKKVRDFACDPTCKYFIGGHLSVPKF